MFVDPTRVELARQLSARLERLSVDSIWARRAGGLRGNLLRWLDAYDGEPLSDGQNKPALNEADRNPADQNPADRNPAEPDPARLEALIERGYAILTAAARQIEVPEDRR